MPSILSRSAIRSIPLCILRNSTIVSCICRFFSSLPCSSRRNSGSRCVTDFPPSPFLPLVPLSSVSLTTAGKRPAVILSIFVKPPFRLPGSSQRCTLSIGHHFSVLLNCPPASRLTSASSLEFRSVHPWHWYGRRSLMTDMKMSAIRAANFRPVLFARLLGHSGLYFGGCPVPAVS